jgi:mannosyltransferase
VTAWFRNSVRPDGVALAGIVLVAAILRFATIGDQSYWYDEVQTAWWIRPSFGDTLSALHSPGEAEPPVYFVVAWLWTRIFGVGEVGLRSLSAVAGVLTVPVAYLAARTLVNRRAGLAAAAFVALSPVLIWYSQEARAYGLFVLLSALSFLFFARALRSPRATVYAAWSIASGLAIATHYFALFLVAPEAVWLLARATDRRRAALAVGGVVLFGGALLPLALYQRDHGGVEWIGRLPMRQRLEDAAGSLATGFATPGALIAVVGGIGFACVLAAVVWRGDLGTRRGAAVALAIGAAALGGPVVAAAAGSDYVLDRNLLAGWIPLAIVVASGVAMTAFRPAGVIVGVAICAAFVWYDVKLATNEGLARDDWRGVARVLGPARADRVVVVAPGWQVKPLAYYRRALRPMATASPVREVDVIVFHRPGWGRDAPPQPPPAGPFRVVERRSLQRMAIVRFRAPEPATVAPAQLATAGENGSRPFIERAVSRVAAD